MDFADATDPLMDTETYYQAGAGLAGYMGGFVAENVIDSRVDVPDELYGIAVIAAAGFSGVPYAEEIMVGGGIHAAESAAERVGVRSTIVNLGSGSGGN